MKRYLPLHLILAGSLLLSALFIRLVALDQFPLMPQEAAAALEAAGHAGLGSPFWQGQLEVSAPAYISLTAGLMSLFGSTETVARLLPALFGAGLVALPFFLDRGMDWPSRLVASFILAISAATLAISRSAGGLSLAVFGIGLAALQVSLHNTAASRQRILIGLGLGLAFSAGAQAWTGVFGLALALLFSRIMPASTKATQAEETLGIGGVFRWETGLAAAVSTVLLATAFGTNIAGLAGVFEAPGRWLLGWASSRDWPLLTALAIPFFYEPLLIFIGGFGAIRVLRSGEPFERRVALWALGSLLVYLIYPGRTPADFVWVSLPLALLASKQIIGFIEAILNLAAPLSSLLLGLVLLIVFSFSYLQLEASAAGFGLASLDREAQLAFSLTALAFAGLLILLFGLGWSWPETLLAFALALVVSLTGLSTASAWRLSFGAEVPEGRELWHKQVTTEHLPLLEETLAEISKWSVGREGGLDVQVQGQASPALAWGLREHRKAVDPMGESPPPVILAPELASAELPADYLGQAFALSKIWDWQGALPPNMLGWWLDRQAPVQAERWILYVRTDVAELGNPAPALEIE